MIALMEVRVVVKVEIGHCRGSINVDRTTNHHNNLKDSVVYTTDVVQMQITIHHNTGMDGCVIVLL